jgi:methionine synthase I (cobalamin-dependent)/5,10-methylenetetrahydrofolate reductase
VIEGDRRYTSRVRLLEALSQRVLIGDGANGTCLSQRGFKTQPYDLANLDSPATVLEVHRAYFDAGSDFIETNTFQSNRFRLLGTGADPGSVNRAAGQLAREAAGPDRIVLGAIGPVGHSISPIGTITDEEVAASVREQAEALLEFVDGFILETYIDLNEIRIAVQTIKSLTDLPILASKAFIEDGEMLAEGLAFRAAEAMSGLGVAAVGANCIVGPQRMLDLVRQIREATDLPILAFPTPGLPQLVKGEVVYDTDPAYFAKAVLRLAEEGARVIGGCCGTTPEHIRQLRHAIGVRTIKVRAKVSTSVERKERGPLETARPSELSHKIGRKFVVAVEMDVPKGLNLNRLLAGAHTLKMAGADVINISDGARARLRMNPAVVSSIIQNEVGIEVTMHFSCRDRNLLAVQSDLLGCHALGLRNILAVTGDPSTIGDYPSATSVFDVDAIGLCRILSRFNGGFDLAGNSVGVKCGFTIACAYNPLALDQNVEIDRLARKKDAGAQLVYTQPVFSEQVVAEIAEVCHRFDLPFLVGVLPLRNPRHTEFMHNEVPGIQIPAGLRRAIMDAPDDQAASEIGIEAAQNLGQTILSHATGIYLMPPFGNQSVAKRIIESLNASAHASS